MLLHTPVSASAFWSVSGMRAPVHYDDHDILIVQLAGTKRWYVANRPSQLFNAWKGISGNPPDLGTHDVVDMAPGDLMYLPRGTFHTVDSDAFSVHLALGFTPLTLREALIAALDHLSDLDRPLRETVGGRLAWQLEGSGIEGLAPATHDAARRLADAVQAPGFLSNALQRRASRAIGGLAPLPRPQGAPALSLDTTVRHAGLAACHLSADADTIDFAYPGGHLYIHRGATTPVLYVVDTPRFRVRDIEGDVADEVRLALAERFVQVGFLEVE
ncbi:MAG TPA: cupin domain-containing protein [Phenylobacterium sp.]|nr:cupin domain-containing protein [Phenylobacterium sp.]